MMIVMVMVMMTMKTMMTMVMVMVRMLVMVMVMVMESPAVPPIASNLFLDNPVFFSASARYSARGLSLPTC